MTLVATRPPWTLGTVTLSLERYAYAAHKGVDRQVNALENGLTSLDAHHHDALGGHASGAVCECALADWLDVPWDPTVGITHASQVDGDVLNIEARSTVRVNGRLLMHDYSFDDRPYALVLANQPPTFTPVGWLWGRDGKQPRYWNARLPRPCYSIPQPDLRPMHELLWLLGFLEEGPS